MAKLDRHLLKDIDKYQTLIKDAADDPQIIDKHDCDWITQCFLPDLCRCDNAPKDLIESVRTANRILYDLVELDVESPSEKIRAELFGTWDLLYQFIESASGKVGEILEVQAKPLILQLAEKLRVMHKFSYRIIASLPFSITTLDGKKATPAPITTSDDISANCKFLTTWEDVFDSYSNAFEQFLLWNEDAISLASNIQYEKNRELLISLTRIKHRATEILSSIKHDRKSKSTLASGQDEIDTARGSLTNLLNCDLPDCSAVDFFVELKDLPSFADELEVVSHISAPEMTAGKAGETKTIATKLHKNDRCILQALANSKERIYQVDLEQTTRLSRKTISKRLKKLQKADYVSYPEGERGGIEITEAGKNALLGSTQ